MNNCSQVLSVDPTSDQSWKSMQQHIRTDEVHAKDRLNPTIETPGMLRTCVLVGCRVMLLQAWQVAATTVDVVMTAVV